MIKIRNVYAQMIGRSSVLVMFDVADMSGSDEDYNFELHYSSGDASAFVRDSCVLRGFFFESTISHIGSGSTDEIFYRVAAIRKDGSEEPVFSDVVALNVSSRNLESAALRNIYHDYARKVLRLPFLYYRKKRSGFFCPECRIPAMSGISGKSNCASCFGTGYSGGYYPAVSMFAISTVNTSAPKNDSGVIFDSNVVQITSGAPPVAISGDLFHDVKRNKTLLVDRVTKLETRGDVYGQLCVCLETPQGSSFEELLGRDSSKKPITSMLSAYHGYASL